MSDEKWNFKINDGELVKKKQCKKVTGVCKYDYNFRFTTLEIRWQYATE